MPYEKIFISHKFGIISQSHKRILQERLLQRRLNLEKSAKKNKKNEESLSLQITEDFVKEYNESSLERRLRLDHQCLQMFEKIKKKLNTAEIDDLSIQLAWAELSQLCQCASPIRDDCMDLFITTLKHTRLSESQMPTLFFLAETVIYWIRTDIVNQPFLRSFELKLLKVSYLIFHRIYFHYLEESLDNQDDLKEHLSIYLHGFEECLNAYTPYPDALFYMNFIVRVGNILKSSIKTDNANSLNLNTDLNNNNSNKSDSELVQSNEINSNEIENSALNIDSNLRNNIVVENSDYLVGSDDNNINENNNDYSSDLMTNKKVPALLPLLKHSIILFNYLLRVKNKPDEEKLEFHLNNILECSSQINNSQDYFIECINAFYILGECSKMNVNVLHVFLSISRTSFIKLNDRKSAFSLKGSSMYNNNINDKNENIGMEQWDWELACLYVEILSDIVINSTSFLIKKKALFGFHNDETDVLNQLKSLRNDLIGYGLIDSARFQLANIQFNSEKDWSWKVRYTAIKALVKICKIFNNNDFEELRKICWSFLIIFEESETNQNVLEAIRVGQVNDNFSSNNKSNSVKSKSLKSNEKKTIQTLAEESSNTNIYNQMAVRLFELMDESKRDVISKMTKTTLTSSDDKTLFSSDEKTLLSKNNLYKNSSSISNSVKNRLSMSANKTVVLTDTVKKRTTLKEELIISNQFQNKIPGYFNRKSFDLMRIVEDQYRKEQIQNFEKESKENS